MKVKNLDRQQCFDIMDRFSDQNVFVKSRPIEM